MKELQEAITAVEEERFSDFSKIIITSLSDKFRNNPKVREMADREFRMKGIQDAFRDISRKLNVNESSKIHFTEYFKTEKNPLNLTSIENYYYELDNSKDRDTFIKDLKLYFLSDKLKLKSNNFLDMTDEESDKYLLFSKGLKSLFEGVNESKGA